MGQVGTAARTLATPSEEDLVAGLLDRDESALEMLIAIHGGTIYGFVRRLIFDATMAEEVAQDTFLALWAKPGIFDPVRGSLRALLIGIARRKAIDALRKQRSWQRVSGALELESDPVVSVEDSIETQVTVDSALKTLTPLQREAILLAYYEGLTYREVAVRLGVPEGTAKTRLRDALISLRKTLGSRAAA